MLTEALIEREIRTSMKAEEIAGILSTRAAQLPGSERAEDLEIFNVASATTS